MMFMKILNCSLAMHHGKFQLECFLTEFLSIMEVKNMFVLSELQPVSGTSTPIKSFCTF